MYGLSHPHFRSAVRTMWIRTGSSRCNYHNGTPNNQHGNTTNQYQNPFQHHVVNNIYDQRSSRPSPLVICGQKRVLRSRGQYGIYRQPTFTTDPTQFRTEVSRNSQHEMSHDDHEWNFQGKPSQVNSERRETSFELEISGKPSQGKLVISLLSLFSYKDKKD